MLKTGLRRGAMPAPLWRRTPLRNDVLFLCPTDKSYIGLLQMKGASPMSANSSTAAGLKNRKKQTHSNLKGAGLIGGFALISAKIFTTHGKRKSEKERGKT